MKHTFLMTVILVCLCWAVLSCGPNGGRHKTSFEKTFDKEASYALGLLMGTNFKGGNVYPDIDEFIRGMTDVLSDSDTRITLEEAEMLLDQAFKAMDEERAAKEKEAENAFLVENSKKPGIQITGSGLQYEVITEGNGPTPEASDTVKVHFEGSLTNGTVFDSSYASVEPIEIPLMQIMMGLPGLAEGLQLMGVGGKYRLYIPSDIGYGSQGGGQIPPYSTLVFEVELFDIIQQD
jgi:FKBP-type peptidyl-prolyl cis-trans isomerase FkpA